MFTDSLPYPDWYKLEKETLKTISKLYSIKDLSFYLNSPDEYIRRIAIIRINDLKLKDSIDILKEIMDEPYESSSNKELAAWTIKVISKKWNTELFISNKLLSRFTGNEKLEDIFKVSIIGSTPFIKYDFSSELIDKELQLDKANSRQYEDINFDMPFSIRDWLRSYIMYLCSNSLKIVKEIPKLITSKLKIIFTTPTKRLLQSTFSYIKHSTLSIHKGLKGKPASRKEKNLYYHSPAKKNIHSNISIKNFIVNILCIVFFPIRMVIKHKMLFFCTFLALYCLLTLTIPGKILTYKYTGMDLSEIQRTAFYSAKDFVSFAFREAKTLAGADTSNLAETTIEDISPSVSLKQYRVTAKDGLNLRASPDGTSPKVLKEALKYNSVVEFEGISKKDSSGRLWYFVNTSEGISGWVNAKWLKESTNG